MIISIVDIFCLSLVDCWKTLFYLLLHASTESYHSRKHDKKNEKNMIDVTHYSGRKWNWNWKLVKNVKAARLTKY